MDARRFRRTADSPDTIDIWTAYLFRREDWGIKIEIRIKNGILAGSEHEGRRPGRFGGDLLGVGVVLDHAKDVAFGVLCVT